MTDEDFAGKQVNKFKGKTGICPRTGSRRPLKDIMLESGEWEKKRARDYEREFGEKPTAEDLKERPAQVVEQEEIVIPQKKPEPVADLVPAEQVELEALELPQLKEYAKSQGIKFSPNIRSKSKLIAKIKAEEKQAAKSKL